MQVLPGFEPGSLDSKSKVLTYYTIRPDAVAMGFEPTKRRKRQPFDQAREHYL